MIPARESISWSQTQELDFGETQQENSQRFLRFPLNSEVNGLLPLAKLQGVITVNLKEILPAPQVSPFLLGILNWRGEAIWIVDLANLLGATHWCRQETVTDMGMAMLVEVEGQTVGLLVEDVNTIENYNPELCLPITESMLVDSLRVFFQGYFLDEQEMPLILLDFNALIQALKH